MPNPRVNVVIPRRTTVSETPNSAAISGVGGAYTPALYAVAHVAAHDRKMTRALRAGDHLWGSVKRLRSGSDGRSVAGSDDWWMGMFGLGRGVSKVRYRMEMGVSASIVGAAIAAFAVRGIGGGCYGAGSGVIMLGTLCTSTE